MLENQTTTNRGEIVGAIESLQSQIIYNALFVGASFYDTTIQTNAGATAVNIMSFDTIDFNNDVILENGTDITVSQSGYYNLQFSAQFDKTDSGDDSVQIWFTKNGQNISNSATELFVIGNNAKFVASWNYYLSLNANDYVQVAWHSSDTNMRLFSGSTQSNPDRPAIPSVILTINKIGN